MSIFQCSGIHTCTRFRTLGGWVNMSAMSFLSFGGPPKEEGVEGPDPQDTPLRCARECYQYRNKTR